MAFCGIGWILQNMLEKPWELTNFGGFELSKMGGKWAWITPKGLKDTECSKRRGHQVERNDVPILKGKIAGSKPGDLEYTNQWFVDYWFYHISSIGLLMRLSVYSWVYYCRTFPFFGGWCVQILFKKSFKVQETSEIPAGRGCQVVKNPMILGLTCPFWTCMLRPKLCLETAPPDFILLINFLLGFFHFWIFLGCIMVFFIPIRRHISIIGFLVTSNYVTMCWYLKHDRPQVTKRRQGTQATQATDLRPGWKMAEKSRCGWYYSHDYFHYSEKSLSWLFYNN